MSATTLAFFLVAIIGGQGDAAAFATLGVFPSAPACDSARLAVDATLATGESPAVLVCAKSTALAALAGGDTD